MTEAEKEELVRKIRLAAATMKTVTGVCNNASIAIMYDAYSEISGNAYDSKGNTKPPHPNFKHRVKMLYKRALAKVKEYEGNLLYTKTNRFFHVDDMRDKTRNHYKATMTDQEYFEFWKGTGSYAYNKTRPLVTCLQNKYRVSLVNHDIPNADQMAWAMTASACLKISVQMADNVRQDMAGQIPSEYADTIHSSFTLAPVYKAWDDAMVATQPDSEYELTSTEQRNIEMGVIQLLQEWQNPTIIFDSCMHSVPDFEDIFRTKGVMDKTLRSLAESKDEAERILREEKLTRREGDDGC